MSKHDGSTYYRSGWLIDGSGSQMLKDAVFCVKGKFFQRIFNYHEAKLLSKNIVDMSNYTILPCFIDTHVHLAFLGTTDFVVRKDQLEIDYINRKNTILHNIRQHLLYGITAVRDGGDPNNDILKLKKTFLNNDISRLTVLSPGTAWHVKGRYGKFIGSSFNSLGPNDILADIIYDKKYERSHIKLINSGLNSLSRFGFETLSQFKTDEINLIVNIATSLGKKVMVHANGLIPVKYALDANCHSIEHGFFMGDSNLALMAKKSIVWVPTVFTMKACMDYLYKKGGKQDILSADIASKNLEQQLEQLSIAKKNGVIVALGTDAGSPGINHGVSVKEELKLLIESGYTVEQAVRCATRNGAQLIGCSDIGLIKEGMKANFIAVKSKPHNIISALDNINYVFFEGKRLF